MRKNCLKKLSDLETLATNRFVDTPYNSPSRERYRAQMDARREMLEMIAEAPTITPESLVRQEQQRSGCEFCTTAYDDWSDGFHVKGSMLFYFDHVFGWGGIGVKFCPMCGRELDLEDHP